eukprot:1157036-Pelagomonas_calceolata.AAC.6
MKKEAGPHATVVSPVLGRTKRKKDQKKTAPMCGVNVSSLCFPIRASNWPDNVGYQQHTCMPGFFFCCAYPA